MAMLKSKVKCAPDTARIAVTAWRNAPAKLAGSVTPFQANQSPVISQPSRMVALPSPPATSACATLV